LLEPQQQDLERRGASFDFSLSLSLSLSLGDTTEGEACISVMTYLPSVIIAD